MGLIIVRHADVHAFEARALPWLLQAETEHNLLLGIVEQLKSGSAPTQPYLATVEENGRVAGCAFRTPPYKLGLTRMPLGAINALVEDVAQVYDDLPAVLGPAVQARSFAEAWALCRGKRTRVGMRQRIYELRKVVPPAAMPAGELRLAGPRDLPTLRQWLLEFASEAGVGAPNVEAFAANHIQNRTLFVWEDEGEPRSSALHAGRTRHGVRIGFVYTPPEFRRRGYATACTAAVSQRALDSGFEFCCLYTDLGNPTSNDIYQSIGYVPVCDAVDYVIEGAAG